MDLFPRYEQGGMSEYGYYVCTFAFRSKAAENIEPKQGGSCDFIARCPSSSLLFERSTTTGAAEIAAFTCAISNEPLFSFAWASDSEPHCVETLISTSFSISTPELLPGKLHASRPSQYGIGAIFKSLLFGRVFFFAHQLHPFF